MAPTGNHAASLTAWRAAGCGRRYARRTGDLTEKIKGKGVEPGARPRRARPGDDTGQGTNPAAGAQEELPRLGYPVIAFRATLTNRPRITPGRARHRQVWRALSCWRRLRRRRSYPLLCCARTSTTTRRSRSSAPGLYEINAQNPKPGAGDDQLQYHLLQRRQRGEAAGCPPGCWSLCRRYEVLTAGRRASSMPSGSQAVKHSAWRQVSKQSGIVRRPCCGAVRRAGDTSCPMEVGSARAKRFDLHRL